MKKCPYCAEEIKDEAIVCRYCGRDLVPNVNQVVNSRTQPEVSSSVNTTTKNWELPPDYSPPASDIKQIHKAKLDELQRGGWILLASPPAGGYISHHYNNKVTQQEYAKLKEEILTWAWENSDKTLEDLRKKIYLSSDKVKGSFFSIKSQHMEIAAHDARDYLISGIQLLYSMDHVLSSYRTLVDRLFKYALTRPTFDTNRANPLSPMERLEKIDQDLLFSPKKEIPDEYYGLVLEEAKKQVLALGENPPLYIPVHNRPGMLDDMIRLVEKIANEIDKRHKKAPADSVERMIVQYEEIETMVKDAIAGDSRYDDGAEAFITVRVHNEIRKRGYL